ncbi:cysteine desulfurase NifS [Alkalibaculum sp. M08DMB]|uniref:Cysteine desulfurase IscS n=1 Tax=Alkalibaculum sporogenes TaxID=2655001 RepID=A0A6A7K9T9_9FIRM|nr:cysteine desulfurase NifS [Alkalibaculum sporogenes]MPW26299.1 cysteine desulfurase NifS [Alkalibaculum sporogenes]
MKRVYFDYAATTPLDKEVLEKMIPYFSEKFGNPSSIYSEGREARKVIDEARQKVANSINANANEIFFTGGGTEADNWALKGVAFANKNKGNHIITTVIEHHAVLHTCEYLEKHGFEVTYLKVDEYGLIDIEELKTLIKDTTILISIMFANNEIGTVQPIKEIGQIAKEKNIYFHTDAVQALGNVPIDVRDLKVDLLSISAHKIYGPKGIGALYVRKGVKVDNLVHGGAQERKKRAGTENTPAVVGFGEACYLAVTDLLKRNQKTEELRDYLIKSILSTVPNVQLNGHPTKRLPGNANISFEFIEGESLLLSLDLVGISASSGSACTSGSLDPSHVLLAIGLIHEIAHGSLRVTLGKNTNKEEIDYLLEQLPPIVQRLRDMSPLYIQGGK